MGRPKSTHCKNGHEIAVVGRYPSGSCRGCRVKTTAPYRRGNAPIGICKRGHSLEGNRVMHGGKARGCLTCHRERQAELRAKQMRRVQTLEQRRIRGALIRSCVPTKPLLDLLERRGVPLKTLGNLVGDRLGVKPTAVERLLHRAIGIGAFTIVAADEICVGLDVHPAEVWGAEWFTYGMEVADAV